jgi:hypothetical protein
VTGLVMTQRVKPQTVRRRLLALLERARTETSGEDVRSAEWWAGYMSGIRLASDVIRKG